MSEEWCKNKLNKNLKYASLEYGANEDNGTDAFLRCENIHYYKNKKQNNRDYKRKKIIIFATLWILCFPFLMCMLRIMEGITYWKIFKHSLCFVVVWTVLIYLITIIFC